MLDQLIVLRNNRNGHISQPENTSHFALVMQQNVYFAAKFRLGTVKITPQ